MSNERDNDTSSAPQGAVHVEEAIELSVDRKSDEPITNAHNTKDSPEEEGAASAAGDTTKPTPRASTTDDPFEMRQGKSLTWKSVHMTLHKTKKKPERKILEAVWGEVPKKETTAIMGPSGAGKTSLLNILSGRSTSNSKLSIAADVRLNNYAVDPADMCVRKQIAFVAQEDSLHVASTPRECIRFSAKLRLPRSMTDEQLDRITARMLEELGLMDCADTIVGGGLSKGISGGERKRTSVGIELVTKPAMVFLDEPTSGLDSFSAVQLCQVLKSVAKAGASVLFTIHQPASEIFDSFDHLILLNRGRVMYEGAVETVPDYFEARGQPLPPKYNPADWIMIVAQTLKEEQLEADGFYQEDSRDMTAVGFSTDDQEGKDALGITLKSQVVSNEENRPNMLTQISWMVRRELRSLYRDKKVLGARLFLTGFMSVLIGILFWKVGETDPNSRANLNSHFGGTLVVCLSAMFGTALPSLVVFPQERPVFLREYSTNHYSAIAYFAARLTMELFVTALQMTVLAVVTYFMVGFQLGYGWMWLILYSLAMTSTAIAVLMGSAVDDSKLAMEFLPLCFVPQMLFAGFFVAPELIPVWIRWVQWVMPLTYSVRLFMEQEFGDCGLPCDMLLEDLSISSDDVWWYWLALLGLFACFRLTALVVLARKAKQFY